MPLSNAEKQARHRARRPDLKPAPCDIDTVDRQLGILRIGATCEEQAHRWRLYQAQALIRMAAEDPAIAKVLRGGRTRNRS